MKKITFLLLFLFSSILNAQVCEQIFLIRASDSDQPVLTIERNALNCYSGVLNSITITDARLGFDDYCGEYYSFILNKDGTSSSVCAEDLTDLDITDFNTITITAHDEDGEGQTINLQLKIAVDFTPVAVPICNELTSPLPNATAVSTNGKLGWSVAPGATGYRLSVGTSSNGTEVVNAVDLGNVTSYDIEGYLIENTNYYVKIVPYNNLGSATGCPQSIFTTGAYIAGDFCFNSINLGTQISPLTATTAGANNESSPECYVNTASDLFYYIDVPNGSTLKIGQQSNDYDSVNYIFYGDCTEQNIIACYDDPDDDTITWANQTGSLQRVYWSQDGLHDALGTFTLVWSLADCVNPEATYSVVSLCSGGTNQFNITADLTSLGSAASVTVTDNQSGSPQTVSSPQVLTFGPYENNSEVILTIRNDQNELCQISGPSLTQQYCAPTNDFCATAIDLSTQSSPYTGTNIGATDEFTEGCLTNPGKDVFFSLLVRNGSTVSFTQTTEDYYPINYMFYGDCNLQTHIACLEDNRAAVTWTNTTGADQNVFWVQDGHGGGVFSLEFSSTLGTANFIGNSYRAYPNPVNDVLNLSGLQNRAEVIISNLLGQKIIYQLIEGGEPRINVAALLPGYYLVNIVSERENQTIKILKE